MGDGFMENHFKMQLKMTLLLELGYFMRKNYNEETKIEDVLEHLDGMLDKI